MFRATDLEQGRNLSDKRDGFALDYLASLEPKRYSSRHRASMRHAKPKGVQP